ncbi:MBOAT family protein [Candidatus Peribacteria bacterium]|nr:MBOAT family protein [Candidatus Peribacteria bacterium]
MPLSSPEYLLCFLPIIVAVTVLFRRSGHLRAAMQWLVLASLFFYGYARPVALIILFASVIFNYFCGTQITKKQKSWLAVGIIGNLLLLGTFKYATFFAGMIGVQEKLPSLVLPLAISFYTFTQIAYLVDASRGNAKAHSFVDYLLFVTFFPNLLAGPIARHSELAPQFTKKPSPGVSPDLAIGMTMLIIGLFKKVVIADTIATYANLVFNGATSGMVPTFAEAWIGALAYTMQLYFDFSGYSDMAIGSARMMGFVLPVNFNAPYRSLSIREFWKRWHMTLSRFIQEYLYIPLGGSRKGEVRTLVNLLVTMLLAGLWHGAGWTFVIWGGLHGVYLVINRIWTKMGMKLNGILALPLTLLSIVVGWVFFRADSLTTAMTMLQSMAGLNGMHWTLTGSSLATPLVWWRAGQMLIALAVLVMVAPTTQAFLGIDDAKPDGSVLQIRWKPTVLFALCSMILAVTSITTLFLSQEHVFLYFQF